MTAAAPDVVVVGLGGLGLACAAHLAERGLRVLGLERDRLHHAPAAASARATRGFRQAYPVDPELWVPLTRRALAHWRTLERSSGRRLLHLGGALQLGPADHPAVRGVAHTCAAFDLPCDVLEPRELARRCPALRMAPGEVAVLEHQAGVLLADACNRAHEARARAAGAQLREHAAVHAIEPSDHHVGLRCSTGAITARYAVLAPGAGLPALLEHLPTPLGHTLRIEHQTELELRPATFPGPLLPLSWVAPDGHTVDSLVPGHAGHPLKLFRKPGIASPESAERATRSWLEQRLPLVADAFCTARHTTPATLTPDRRFLLGPHPASPHLLLAGALCGHGYKLVPVLAEAIADLVEHGTTALPIEAFAPQRLV